MIIQPTRFQGIYETIKGKKRSLLTINLSPGKKVYDEILIRDQGVEYRTWNPKKSKLAAAIMKGASQIGIKPSSIVLYLGCASGTTASHVSDIVGKNGFVFALDFAPRVMREIVFVCENRSNIMPIMADANNTESFEKYITMADVIFQDIAQKSQAEIFLKNCRKFLKSGGFPLLSVKARSIDVAKKPKKVFEEIRRKLENELTIVDYRTLEPLELDHCMFICKKK
ncbi:fibrillarin-like rRNA/tRNA 2'-O-methyltransferase [Candidatus Woesearchaeota archaeon]|nr:fibrillarin-like rRNA/tRNA 2'-O-methyltransferase [Candidatus Woesearchaeota archaeon]